MIPPLGTGELDVGGGATAVSLFNAIDRGIGVRIVGDKGRTEKGYIYQSLVIRKALIDSGIASDAARFMVTKIGDEPANTEAMKQVPDSVFTTLGLTRDLDAFLKSGIFQKPLPNKDKIVAAWTEIKAGVQ
jgi:hypothetical protein